jgi:hypothetical protein
MLAHQTRSRCRDDDAGCTRTISPWPFLFVHESSMQQATASVQPEFKEKAPVQTGAFLM